MSSTTFGDMCLCMDTADGVACSEPFTITVEDPEPTCEFYEISMDDVSITYEEMMAGSFD
jgi:hypothetical protein